MADNEEVLAEEMPGDRVVAESKSVAAEFERDPLDVGMAHDEKNVVQGSSPCPSDGHEAASVYVVSSGEDEDDCPDEEDYDELDDMDEDDFEEDEEDIEEEEELEDEETDEEEEHVHLEGEDSDDGREILYRRQLADDWDPRYSNGIGPDHMERSQSLQDLSICGLPAREHPIKKRRSVDVLDHKNLDYHHNSQLYVPHRRHSTIGKFDHIESKVKLYIRDMKEMRRMSMEKRRKSKEIAMVEDPMKHEEKHSQAKNQEVPKNTRIKNLKEFAESTIKELEDEEAQRLGKVKDTAEREVENGPTDLNNKSLDVRENLENHRDEGKKPNGAIVVEMVEDSPKKGVEVAKSDEVCLENGVEEVQTILNIRTMDYDEYMRGSSNSKLKTPIDPEVHAIMYESNGPSMDNEFPETVLKNNGQPCEFKIDNVKSIGIIQEEKEEHDDSDVIMETSDQDIKLSSAENSEAALLRSQLDQKTSQCRAMRDAYEKTLSENFELKQELEDLRKVLAGYRKEKKPKETKTTAVQTDFCPAPPPPQPDIIKEPTSSTSRINKCSTSTLGSVASSNEMWQDSAGTSPFITMTPPSLTPLLTSDDSYTATEAPPRRSSHAFITSSRIMKTLSSITHGKSKVNSSIEGQKSEGMTPIQPSNSKKRKATELPANVNLLQPPKIAHTSEGRSQKRSRTEENVFKYPGDYLTSSSRKQSETAGPSGKEGDDEEEEENDDDDQANGVKCFTFNDDENGQEKSFLIQAEGETEDSERAGVVRECGPYLLGNVEVRMSEVNGTINIWGKEISQDSTASETPSMNTNAPEELDDSSTRSCCQNTPHTRFASSGHMVCSTNKKPKILPLSLDKSIHSKSSRSTLASGPKLSTSSLADSFNQHRQQPSCSFNTDTANNCPNCKSRFCANYKRSSSYREHLPLMNDSPKNRCDCHWEHNTCDRAGKPSQGEHRCSLNPGRTSRCSVPNNTGDFRESFNEGNCRHHAAFASIGVNSCRFNPGKSNSFRENIPCGDHSTSSNCSFPGGGDSHCRDSGLHQDSPLIDNEEEPLLPHRSCEVPEMRRRRLIGKRVRGILGDLLGCGDCRNNKVNKVGPNNCENDAPQIRVTSCTPPSACTNAATQIRETQQTATHYGSTNRCAHSCCTACARRAGMATEIEIQLESFRAEMERLRSRSDVLLNMLITLNSTDAI